MRRALIVVLLAVSTWALEGKQPAPQPANAPAVGHMSDPFATGWMVADTNGDGIADAVTGKIVVPEAPTAAENAAAANIAARVAYGSTGLTLPLVVAAPGVGQRTAYLGRPCCARCRIQRGACGRAVRRWRGRCLRGRRKSRRSRRRWRVGRGGGRIRGASAVSMAGSRRHLQRDHRCSERGRPRRRVAVGRGHVHARGTRHPSRDRAGGICSQRQRVSRRVQCKSVAPGRGSSASRGRRQSGGHGTESQTNRRLGSQRRRSREWRRRSSRRASRRTRRRRGSAIGSGNGLHVERAVHGDRADAGAIVLRRALVCAGGCGGNRDGEPRGADGTRDDGDHAADCVAGRRCECAPSADASGGRRRIAARAGGREKTARAAHRFVGTRGGVRSGRRRTARGRRQFRAPRRNPRARRSVWKRGGRGSARRTLPECLGDGQAISVAGRNSLRLASVFLAPFRRGTSVGGVVHARSMDEGDQTDRRVGERRESRALRGPGRPGTRRLRTEADTAGARRRKRGRQGRKSASRHAVLQSASRSALRDARLSVPAGGADVRRGSGDSVGRNSIGEGGRGRGVESKGRSGRQAARACERRN